MPGTAGHTTRVSRPVFRQLVGSSDEKRTRRYARHFSHINITYTGDISSSGRSTPPGPNVEKDLPRIPSTSTGLWDAEPITVSSEMVASPVTSPKPSLPPLPGSKNLRRTPTTEAQQIAARYRRRDGSSEVPQSEVSCPPKLEYIAEVNNPGSQVDPRASTSDVGLFARSGSKPATCGQVPSEPTNLVPGNEEHPSMDLGSEVSSFLPATPTIRRLFAWEVDAAATSYEVRRILRRVGRDGPFSCSQKDCHDVLPTRKAYTCHFHIHVIHEELRSCELCWTWFINDEHKDDHLNSCPKLPTFHEIESFNNEPPLGPLQNLLNRLHF